MSFFHQVNGMLLSLNELFSSHIVHLILEIPIPSYPTLDVPCWGITSSGEFFVRTATWLAHGINSNSIPWPFNRIWKINVARKVQICRQCLQNGLQLKLNLANRQIINDAICPLCKSNNKTLNHLFFTRPIIGPSVTPYIYRIF